MNYIYVGQGDSDISFSILIINLSTSYVNWLKVEKYTILRSPSIHLGLMLTPPQPHLYT